MNRYVQPQCSYLGNVSFSAISENIINLELDQANEAAHNPIENYNIEFREGLTEEYLDQLPERSDDTTWNMGYQNNHYTYLSELTTELYKDRDILMLLDNKDVVLEIIDEAIYQPEISIRDMQHIFIYQHISIHYRVY